MTPGAIGKLHALCQKAVRYCESQ